MQWDAILKDSLLPAAPYAVWLVLALATSIFVAIIREPLCRVLRDARDQLAALRTRFLTRSALSLGRRFHRFWQSRRREPVRTVAASLERLASALPRVGQPTMARVITLEADLRKQLGLLEALGLHPPSPRLSLGDDATAVPGSRGSWWKLLMLTAIAGLTGAANSFLLNEFFQGVITSDPLFPSAFPDLHVSHVFAVLIFTMEVAIGFALHHFAEEPGDQTAARRLLSQAPWLVLVGLLWLEGWAYALLSYQIDIPERLNLPATSGLYSFARYFLALFGAGLTLLLASLGYLLGKEVEKLQAGTDARRHARLLKRQGWAAAAGTQQIERAGHALERLHQSVRSFQLNLVHQFRKETETTSSAEDLATLVRDAIGQILDSAQGEGRALRTRAQALADMSLFTTACGVLGVVSWASGQYIATFVREVQGDRPSGELFALVSGTVMVGFTLSAGYVASHAWSGTRPGTGVRLILPRARKLVLRLLALALLVIAAAGLVGVAVGNHTLGPLLPLNVVFGLGHASILILLGAGAEAAIVNTLHLVRLGGLHLERWVGSLVAAVLWLARAMLAVLEWIIRVASVFGQLVVRTRRPVRVNLVEVSRVASLPRELRAPARRFADKAYDSVREHA